MSAVILHAEGLTKRFGKFTAVADVDLEVREGEIHCVIGPNGAGKSTLFGMLSGELSVSSGRVQFDDEDITGLKAWKRTRRGIARSFQVARVFPTFTVRENVRGAVLANRSHLWWFWRDERRAGAEEEIDQILANARMTSVSEVVASELSLGDRKRLEVAMAMASTPKLFMFDEPTAGMSTAETAATIELIRGLRDHRGCSVLLTEHDMSVVFGLADRLTVMHHGEILTSGRPEDVRDDPEVHAVYLGTEGGTDR